MFLEICKESLRRKNKEYSFEASPAKDRHHFTSVRPSQQYSPNTLMGSQKRESRIPRMRGSLDARTSNKKKHNFHPSGERSTTPKDRSHSARRPYESQTQSSMNRNFLTARRSIEAPINDEEHESMEMQPPVPHNHSRPQTETPDIEKDKSHSLELRLLGTTKALRSLEKEKREKDQEVKLLQLELSKKDRIIESLKSENLDPNIRQRRNNSNASSFLQQRKKERDMEAKIKELEKVISEERKHMNRLQHLNTQLLAKIKTITNTEKVMSEEGANYSQIVKSLKNENNNLRLDKKQILEEYQELKDKFDHLIHENTQLATRYDEVVKSAKLFEENALELYESHQILTEKLMRH